MAPIHVETESLLQRYLAHFPGEAGRFALLRQQLASNADLFVRSNMTGHVTSSAAVLNPAGTKVLLIDHVFLQKRLAPGGHYDAPGSLLQSALREVQEETGVDDAAAHAWTARTGIPLDIDSHAIPANPKKGEGAHVHHDFLFLATASERAALQAQLAEVHSALWAPLSELRDSSDPRGPLVYQKLQMVGAIAL